MLDARRQAPGKARHGWSGSERSAVRERRCNHSSLLQYSMVEVSGTRPLDFIRDLRHYNGN